MPLALAPPACARTLVVGPALGQQGAAFTRPSEAAAAARAGDRIRILAGTYYDCAVWSADFLVIEGTGPDTRLTDTTCQGKAIMVIDGRGVAVRDLTLARARVPDGNGAGIRAEGPDLVIQRVRFENNQDGLLAADQPDGVLRIEDSVFSGNGAAAGPHPTAALVVGSWARLIVHGTTFEGGTGQAAILSNAALTRIEASRIAAVSPGEGATVQAGGGLEIEDTLLGASAGPRGRHAAVLATPAASPGRAAATPLLLRRDTLQGAGTLLLNWSGRPAQLNSNTVGPGGVEASTAGAWSYRLRRELHRAYDAAHAAAGALHRRAMQWLHG